ncbi:MarR family winged helix-turn-helix transcriptional regulator [Devosia oryzisoli]|uniref:MarR family winged helix-turn-helix transcriptional regulator n=1 Tax=Devosia oryzisoli TaxID=2774138 RepID=UPI001AEF2769
MSKPETIDVKSLLSEAGLEPATLDAVSTIDGLFLNWRRRASRRELGQAALATLDIPLDLPQLDVLFAIAGPLGEPDGGDGETMVGTVADRLSIDPSRASRMVSEMVEKGYARRAVSQADARRTIIELTAGGKAVVEAVRAYKFLIMGDFLSQWPKEDVANFVPLLLRFSQWLDHVGTATDSRAGEVAALAEAVKAATKDSEPA